LNEILWYNPAAGQVGTYFAWGAELIANPAVGPRASAGWDIAGSGDFNGDGRDDILWRHEQGALSNWLGTANGSFTVNDANAFANVSNDWQVVGIGDYNGDGRDDLLWRNLDSGALSNWLGTPTGGFEINDDDAFIVVPKDWLVQPFPLGFGAWDY
jgi:hypothetical protein